VPDAPDLSWLGDLIRDLFRSLWAARNEPATWGIVAAVLVGLFIWRKWGNGRRR
jgi:hypothetical protein